jgi:hypothetical protein
MRIRFTVVPLPYEVQNSSIVGCPSLGYYKKIKRLGSGPGPGTLVTQVVMDTITLYF